MAAPQFIDTNADTIWSEIKSYYEGLVGFQIQPAQVETLVLKTLEYRDLLNRVSIQRIGEQNLLEFAEAPIIDYLGKYLGVTRLSASPATATLQFTLVTGHAQVTIPFNTKIASTDGKVVFATDETKVITVGINTVTISATCQSSGVVGNNYAIGTISELIDPLAFVTAVSNTTITGAGFDDETDDNLRKRIYLAPSALSTCGTEDGYKYWTYSVSSEILDVTVKSDSPGIVKIYPLTSQNDISTELINNITNTLSAKDKRPLCDTVTVLKPTYAGLDVEGNVKLYSWVDEAETVTAINKALRDYCDSIGSRLGVDTIRASFVKTVMGVSGVYNYTLTSPIDDYVNNDHTVIRYENITTNVTAIITEE